MTDPLAGDVRGCDEARGARLGLGCFVLSIAMVALDPRDLLMRRNFGQRAFREIQDKLAAMGLSLGMTLDGPSYTGTVLATVAARIASAAE